MALPEWMLRRLRGERPEGAPAPAPTSPFAQTRWQQPAAPWGTSGYKRAPWEPPSFEPGYEAPAPLPPFYLPTVWRGAEPTVPTPTPLPYLPIVSKGPGGERAAVPTQRPTPYPGAVLARTLPGFRRPEKPELKYTPATVWKEPFPALRAEMLYEWEKRTEPAEGGPVPAWKKFTGSLADLAEGRRQIVEEEGRVMLPGETVGLFAPVLARTIGLTTSPLRGLMSMADTEKEGLVPKAGAAAGQAVKTGSAGLVAGLSVLDIPVEELYGRRPTGTPAVYRDLVEKYGESKELYDATYRSAGIAWSGSEAQKRAAERMYHGESYGSAVYGNYEAGDPVRALALSLGAYKDPETGRWTIPESALPAVISAIQQTPDVAEYFGYAVELQGEDPREVATTILNDGVKGEWNPVWELAGRIVLDFGSILGAGRKIAGLAGAPTLVERRFFDGVREAGSVMTDLHPDDLYQATAKSKLWNLLEKLPETKQDLAIGITRDVLHRTVVQLPTPGKQLDAMDAYAKLAGSPDEVAEAVKTLDRLNIGRWTVKDARLAKKMGVDVGAVISPLESEVGKLGSFTFRRALSVKDAKTGKWVYKPEALQEAVKGAKTADDAVRLLVSNLVAAVEGMYPAEKHKLVKANRAFKGFFAKWLHMGLTPAYAWRNIVQNTVQGLVDGLSPFASRKKVDALFENLATETTAALRGLGSGGPGGELLHERAVEWAKRAGDYKPTTLKDILEGPPALWLSGVGERMARRRGVAAGAQKILNRWLKPGMMIGQDMVDELAGATSPEFAKLAVQHVMTHYNPKDWDVLLEMARQEAEVIETFRTLDPEVIVRLQEMGVADEVMDLLRRADSPETWTKGIDALVNLAYKHSDEMVDAPVIQEGTFVGRAKDAIDALLTDLGWAELPKPLSWENYKKGQEVLARNGELIQGAKDRALYYVIESGDEDLMLELIETYARMEGQHGRMLADLANFREATVSQALAAADAENWSEVRRVWQYYNARSPEIVFEHYDDLVDTFADIARRGKEMGASERTADLIRVLDREVGMAPTRIHVDVTRLATRAAEDLGYGHGTAQGARAHMANTLAQEFAEVTGKTVDEKLDSFARAVEEGKLDPDDVWRILREHQIKRGRVEGEVAEAVEETAPVVEEAAEIPAGIVEELPTEARTITQEVTRQTAAPSIENPTVQYEFRHRIVDLDELKTSHKWRGNELVKAEGYPAALQKRLRERGASQMQVQEIAQRLQPDMLLRDTRSIDRGSPIVGSDLAVESGNGRVLALHRARDFVEENYARYVEELRARLPEFGLTEADLEGVRYPVLVRERLSEVDRVSFAAEANRPVTMMMSALENALADAELIEPNRLANLQMGETTGIEEALRAQQNRPFVQSFLNRLPKTEQAALVDKTGTLNAQGIERVKWAMFRKVYGGDAGARLSQAFLESADPTMLNVRQAMLDSLPQMARAEALIDAGRREEVLRLGDDIAAAVDQYRRVQADPSLTVAQYINQPKLFGEPDLTEAQFELLRFINEQGLRRKTPFRDLLRGYAQWVEGLPDKAQLGFEGLMGPTRRTKPEVLRELTKQLQPEAEGLFAGLAQDARIATGGPTPGRELAGGPTGLVEEAPAAVRDVAAEVPETARTGEPAVEAVADIVAEAPDDWVRKEQEVKAVFRRLGELMDDGHLPTPKQIADSIAPELETELLKVRDLVLGKWGQKSGRVEDVAAVQKFLDGLRPRMNTLRQIALDVGDAATNFAYHNYGDRARFDELAGFLWMYPFWYSRTYTKWARRLLDQPWIFSSYFNLQDYLHEKNKALPEWWHDQIKVAHVLGEDYYIPLQGLINPLYGLVDHFRTEEMGQTKFLGRNVGEVVQELGAWGPSTHNMLGYLMALSAYASGDKDAALMWMGYQSQWSKAATNITAGLREIIPGAENAIPPGGIGVEPWMWEMTEEGLRFRGTTFDRKRVGYLLADLVMQGQIDPAEADMAAYFMSGEVYDKALQQHALSRLIPNLVAWLMGTGLKPRHAYEIEVNEMWDRMSELYAARDAGTLTGEDYAAAWRMFRKQYPYFNAIMMTRLDQDERDESLAWSVINRLPPGWQREDVFTEEDVEDLLHKFWDDSGDMASWSEDERRKFMAGVIKLAREKPYPTERQTSEWGEARRRYAAVMTQGQELFGENIGELEDQYFALPKDKRTAFTEQHPDLIEYWDWFDNVKRQDPLLSRYYTRPPEYWTQSDARSAFYDTYFSSVPPGDAEWALKEDLPLLNAMRDYDVRQWLQEQDWTIEQYKAAIAQVKQWIALHRSEVQGNPMEWEHARAINTFFYDQRDMMFPHYERLIGQYMELGEDWDAKDAFKEANPELTMFWNWRDQFAKTHQLWAKYYRADDYAGAQSPAGAPPRPVESWDDFLRVANPLTVQQFFAALRGQPAPALQELHQQIGEGNYSDWVQYLQQLYLQQ